MRNLGLVVSLVWLSACGGENVGTAPSLISDSAGVRIVDNLLDHDLKSGWRVGPDPVLRVGWSEGEHEFGRISSGDVVPGGGIVLVDRQRNEIVELTRQGSVRRIIGTKGEGPGEFTGLSYVIAVDDTIFAHDIHLQRVTAFVAGEYLTDNPWSRVGPFMFELKGIFPDGSFHFAAFAQTAASEVVQGWAYAPVLRTDRAFRTDTVAMLPSFDVGDGGDNPFRYRGFHMHGAGEAIFARSDLAEVRWFEAHGGLRQIARWNPNRVDLTDDVWDDFAGQFRIFMEGRPNSEEWLARMKSGARGPLPIFGGGVADAAGNVWLGQYEFFDEDRAAFFVIRADGEAEGWVNLPRPMRVLRVYTDEILVVERNAFDEEAVAIYAITRT